MLTSMGDVMREAYKRGWLTTRDGNISLRRNDSFYITPSGGRKYIIHPEHIIKGKISPNKKDLFIDKVFSKPSGELEIHKLLQTTACFKGTRAVVHLHPTHVVAAMEKGWNLPDIANRLQELSRYTEVAPNVPKLPVVSQALAEVTFQMMTEITEHTLESRLVYDIVGQAGHGVTAHGKSPWDAFEHIERLNHACEIILLSGVSPE